MKRKGKILTIVMCLALAVTMLAGCGSNATSKPNDKTVSDKSAAAADKASRGAADKLSGKYAETNVKGAYFVFGADNKGSIVQQGKYKNAEDTIKLQYLNAGDYTTYGKSEKDGTVTLTTKIKGAKSQNKVDYKFSEGDDELMSDGYFAGIYTLAGSKDSRAAFQGDGTVAFIQDFTYKVEGSKVTITQNGSAVTYKWVAKKGNILLKSGKTTVTTLVPAK